MTPQTAKVETISTCMDLVFTLELNFTNVHILKPSLSREFGPQPASNKVLDRLSKVAETPNEAGCIQPLF